MNQSASVDLRYEGPEERLDKVLSQLLSQMEKAPTRSQIKATIERGEVRVNGHVVLKAGNLVKPGSNLSIRLPEQAPSEALPFEFPLHILHEDEELIVLDKPAGISMHPGAGNQSQTLVNALVAHFGSSRPELFREGVRPGIVHRLDKDTTGVVVVAKTAFSLARLSAQFAKRTVSRSYCALVFGTPRGARVIGKESQGRIETQIGRSPRDRKKFAVLETGGKPAITNWKVRERLGYGVLVDLVLGTGRTHQIRVHVTSLQSPIIGDKVYGDFSGLPSVLKEAADAFGRQALHAQSLAFVHPGDLKRYSFESPLPPDLLNLIEIFRAYGDGSGGA